MPFSITKITNQHSDFSDFKSYRALAYALVWDYLLRG